MQTWLDHYTRHFHVALTEVIGHAAVRRLGSEEEVIKMMALLNARSMIEMGNLASNVLRKYGNRALINIAILDLLDPAPTVPIVARRLSRDLITDFSGAECPPVAELDAALSRCNWYVDLPDGAARVGETHCVRAIFAFTCADCARGRVAVVCRSGSPRPVAILHWEEGAPLQQTEGCWNEAVDVNRLRVAVDGLLELAVLYDVTASAADRVPVPRVGAKALASRKARQHLQKASLFSVTELRAPANRFNRPPSTEGRRGWRMDHRVPVRGHFRLQACGVRFSERRLTWIAAHARGPKDGLIRPRLTVLRPAA